jgi:hypothetical protein
MGLRTKCGQTEDRVRTLLYDENDSISFLLPFPAGQPRPGPALYFVGCLHTLSEMGASGLSPWNTSRRGPTVDNFPTVENLPLPKE